MRSHPEKEKWLLQSDLHVNGSRRVPGSVGSALSCICGVDYGAKQSDEGESAQYQTPQRIVGLSLASFRGAPLNAILAGLLVGVCGLALIGWRLFLFGRNVGPVWFGGCLLVAAAARLLLSFGIVRRKHLCNEVGQIRSQQQES